MSEIARRPVELAPLSPELSPQVMAWARELRAQFTALGMSISLFSRLHPIDKGTVSRYLNGKRVPANRWFLDQILAIRGSSGAPVTDEVRAHLVKLQMTALKVAHPHEYRVRKVSDELEIAVTSWQEAERYAQALERELAGRTHTLQDLLTETDHLRAAWDRDRIKYSEEIIRLTQQLALARDRALQAERRVQALEELLDQLETRQSSEDDFATEVTPDNPRAMAGLLDSLRRAGADAQIAMLVERIPDLPLNPHDPYSLIVLLDSLRRAGADAQIAMLVERIPSDLLNFDSPYALVGMLDSFRRAGADAQIAMLVQRVPDLPLEGLEVTIKLLNALRRVRADAQIAMLVERIPSDLLNLNDPSTLAEALNTFRRVGADAQVAMLVERIPLKLFLNINDPYTLIGMLDAFRRIGADAQIAMLVERVPDLPLEGSYVTTRLLDALRQVGTDAQIERLAKRIAFDFSLADPNALVQLLHALHDAGVDDQVMVFAERIAASAPFTSPKSTTRLLGALQDVGAEAQAEKLAERIVRNE